MPESRGLSTRLELRSVDPTANPYLALAALLTAGLDGVKNELEPPKSVDRNIYVMSEEEREAAHIYDLPGTLQASLAELKNDQVIVDSLGSHIFNNFYEAKTIEWQAFGQAVTEWEREQYLELY